MLETDYLMFPFICRYLEKKLKEIRQKFASTSWWNNISRNYWDFLKELLLQSGANGLTVDDARRRGKELDCVHLGNASSPHHLSLTREEAP